LNLQAVVEQTVVGMGYELVDIEFSGRGLLRITIDWPLETIKAHLKKNGVDPSLAPWDNVFVTVDDCEKVSRQLSYLFTVENVDYSRLEISSPGLDRPLKRATDYERFDGQEITVRLRSPVNGRKNFQGVLRHLGDQYGLDWDDKPEAKLSPKEAKKAAGKKPVGMLASSKTTASKKAKKGSEAQAEETFKRLNFVIDDVDRANLVPQIVFNRTKKTDQAPLVE
jgi:ribosome maturation factor RimP